PPGRVDQQAALFGHGCRHKGDAKITFGTGAFALALAGDTVPRDTESGLEATVAWKLGDAPCAYALQRRIHDDASSKPPSPGSWAMRPAPMRCRAASTTPPPRSTGRAASACSQTTRRSTTS